VTFDPTIASTCIARHACKRHNVYCSTACEFYTDLAYQLDLSAIPAEYRGVVVERLPQPFEHIDKLRHFAAVAGERKPNNGLFLVSPTTGTGKTLAACAVAQSYIVARTRAAMRSGGAGLDQLAYFVNTVELLDLLRQAMNDDTAQLRATAAIERIKRADLVILDDVGSNRPTPWVEERFYAIVDGIWRNRTRQTLVVTSNMPLQAIEMSLGARTRSRIEGLTVALNFVGVDHRRKNYTEEGR
jgi:DNA replication protein DnaC